MIKKRCRCPQLAPSIGVEWPVALEMYTRLTIHHANGRVRYIVVCNMCRCIVIIARV